MTTNNKLTNEMVDHRLQERPLERLDDIINATTKIQWQCHTCNNVWFAVPNSILRGSGCPECKGKRKLTNEDIDDKLYDHSIKRLEDYQGSNIPIRWECRNCNHQWKASPNNVITKHSGCPRCSVVTRGISKSNNAKQRALQRITDKNIVLLDPYTRIIDRHNVQCQCCNHQWSVTLNDIVNSNNGCPSCAGLLPLTNQVVDQRLDGLFEYIERIDNVIDAGTKITWRCRHGHTWKATPDSVLGNRSGCSRCNKRGVYSDKVFRRNPDLKHKNATIYLIRFVHKDTPQTFLKVGITTRNIANRFRTITNSYRYEIIKEVTTTLYNAWVCETQIIQKYSEHAFIPVEFKGGHTECFEDTSENVSNLIEQIKENI